MVLSSAAVLAGCQTHDPPERAGYADVILPPLTGTFYGSDNGVYYLQQVGSDVWWAGESVDRDANPQGGFLGPNHVWHRGVDSTSVFHGTLSGATLSGQWVDVNRGSSLDQGTIAFEITVVADPAGVPLPQLSLISGSFRANQLTQGDPVNDLFFQYPDGHSELADFYNRFQLAKKSMPASNNTETGDKLGDTHNPEELRPYRDQTVFYGWLRTRAQGDDEWPHVNYPANASRDFYHFACNAQDGDLDFRIRVDNTRIPADFQPYGWGSANATDEGESGTDEQDIIPKLLNIGLFDPDAAAALQLPMPGTASFIGAEGVMYGRDVVFLGDPINDCPTTASSVLPGWAERGGNSILVNGRPIDGNAHQEHLMLAADPAIPAAEGTMALGGLNGYPLAPGTEVRVTGALILDCGHGIFPASDDEEYKTPPIASIPASRARVGRAAAARTRRSIPSMRST
jgi:hypothetical protein